ncbi:hypothetical protein P7C70_g2512, partial [Phenoliferia sp. Uapishka_3]
MGPKRSWLSTLRNNQPAASALSLALLTPLLLGALLFPSSSEPFLRLATEERREVQSIAVSRRNDVGEKDVIVQAFQMNWKSVARECEEWLGPAGFGYVQKSDIASIRTRFGSRMVDRPEEYLQNGHVHEFRSAFDLKDAFSTRGIASLVKNWGRGWAPSDRAATFVVNHDTERQGTTINFRSPGNAHFLATIFLLAHPYGSPSILSSYEFDEDSVGPPQQEMTGLTNDLECDVGTWRCEHRDPAFMNMVAFRNAARRLPITQTHQAGENRVAFGRGEIGHVAINNEDTAWEFVYHTILPDGSYDKNSSPEHCDSYTITVQGGTAALVVPPRDAVAFYIGATPGNGIDISQIPRARGKVSVAIVLKASLAEDYSEIVIVGGSELFGNWDPSRGLPMIQAGLGGRWRAQVEFDALDLVEFKFVKMELTGAVGAWGPGENRKLRLPASGPVRRQYSWGDEP